MKKAVILAGLVADITGDGHLQGPPKWRIDYTSKNIDELERFNGEIYSLFGYMGKIRKNNTNKWGLTYNTGINNRKIAKLFYILGAPYGNKVSKAFKVPSWILDDKECFRRFICRLFCCEGSVDISSKAIEIKMYKELHLVSDGIRFFNQISEKLYAYFTIKTTNPFLTGTCYYRKKTGPTIGIRMKIKRKADLKLFAAEIGFDDKVKQRKLKILNGD